MLPSAGVTAAQDPTAPHTRCMVAGPSAFHRRGVRFPCPGRLAIHASMSASRHTGDRPNRAYGSGIWWRATYDRTVSVGSAPVDTPRHQKRNDCPHASCPAGQVAKEMRVLVQAAWDAGWWCHKGSKHVICLHPDGHQRVRVATTPGDHRTFANTRAEFRRAGLKV